MKINFFGDVCFNGRFKNSPENKDIKFGREIAKLIDAANFNLVNFEGAETQSDNYLRANVRVVNPNGSLAYLDELGFNSVSLSNNHIFDCGVEGYFETIEKLSQYKIPYVGAMGGSEKSYCILESENKSVAILGFTHIEGLMYKEGEQIGNSFYKDYTLIKSAINEVKKIADYVIIMLHGGEEFSFIPPPFRKRICRKIARMGPDAIVCHHSHTPNTHENYKGVPIFYSLGNFIFDLPQYSNLELVNVGLVLTLDFKDDGVKYSYSSIVADFTTYNIEVDNSYKRNLDVLSRSTYIKSWLKDCYRVTHQKKKSKNRKSNAEAGCKVAEAGKFKLNRKLTSAWKLLNNENRRSIEMASFIYSIYKRLF
ncbi:CapA family protein [Vibrio splendidus]|uniref:CapA family protein n=1 Tax=Vibrio splendidus TaxID=29497 RepID=UPI00352C42FA